MSATTKSQVFTAVHTIGALLPADMLVRISEGKDVSGSTPTDYHLIGSRTVQDEAERHWDYLKGIWRDLRTKLPYAPDAETPADPTGLAHTQWLEPLFTELGFGRLTRTATGLTSDDGNKTFPISHRWHHIPIHLTTWNADLDKRPGPGTVPPQSLVQECLNSADAHLWAVLSNGRQMRLLRDSTSLTGAAYVEFDLEAIFDGELFSEFVLLYRLLHVSRFEVPEGAAATTCRLEKWRTEAIESGVRALDQLREGVRLAITLLGTGFLRHPRNAALRDTLKIEDFHYALLRLVYRLLFLFVAEDRGALLSPDASEHVQRRYRDYFSSARLRRHAERRRGTAHGDLYRALRVVLDGLGAEDGRPELGLPGLGGIFDATDADVVLDELEIANEHLLAAVRALAIVRDVGTKRSRAVDYQHLGAEELGSVYESLLELIPKHDPADRSFEIVQLPGNTRKTTGSYYTPTALIECLLDSALDPVIAEAVTRGETRAAEAGRPDPRDTIVDELLALTVCDPACGSGHFLVAAARRIAKRVAGVREQNPEPTVAALRTALREVVARCIYGVDLNPMAVELAKVSLWLEALEPGKPLGFLDAHIKRGNALLGATPKLLGDGIPDDAFKPIEGDDKKFATALKKLNAKEMPGQDSLFETELEAKIANTVFAAKLRRITTANVETLKQVRLQSQAYREWEHDSAYLHARHVADAWCAAFVWPKTPSAPQVVTNGVFRALKDPAGAGATAATNDEIIRLARQYAFFHWHLEFPEVFTVPEENTPDVDSRSGWAGGFACLLGNPPWERVKLQEQEFFAARNQAIATAPNKAARDKLIKGLASSGEPADRELLAEFNAAKRISEGTSHLLRSSGRFPLAGRGDVNTYAVFAENASRAIGGHGSFGLVLPTGIATDATTAPFFSDLVRSGRLGSFLDFENEAFLLSRDVHHSVRFCLLTVVGLKEHVSKASFAFGTRYMEDLDERRFTLPPAEILLVNPNTGTLPLFRSRRDAEITLGIYRQANVLLREGEPNGNPWGVTLTTMFHMSNDSHLFRTREQLEDDGWTLADNVFERDDQRYLPLYEAKMLHHYDHRLGTYDGQTEAQANMGTLPRLTPEQHDDPTFLPMPRYWAPEFDVPTDRRDARGNKIFEPGVTSQLATRAWDRNWLLGWRDICRASDERTMINFALPRTAVPDGTLLLLSSHPRIITLLAAMSSFPFDFATRQKVGGTHLKFFTMHQLPVLAPVQVEPHASFIVPRALELAFTAYDMAAFAEDFGDTGGPFRWNEERRAVIRAELDALFFHLYGIARDDVDYVMETFPVIKRRDVAKYGSYRTKELILDSYDRMASAGLTLEKPLADPDGFSSLTPPPGKGPRHPVKEQLQ
ncbi:DNA methyltransferase [Streptacidiphilus sp. MAP5-52]|uniref:Eco57I restriction-modification methylase domain-containing protein n=1 Tax=Streptacidiphilus sp. MAP5-52 TaxID=3156267 RepID=UPI003517C1D4